MEVGSPEWKKYRRNIARIHRAKHGNKVRARAIGARMTKKPCELCLVDGITTLEVENHHDDYRKPHKVRWLCKKHHEQVDTELDRQGVDKHG
jgi:hypothetical protein